MATAAYARAYRAAHPEQARAASRAYRAANLEKRRAEDRERHAANPEKYRALSRAWNAAVRARNRIDLRAYKLLNGCRDCGYDENADALEFDHVRGTKRYSVPTALASDNRLREEIAKCEVRCANCHSIKTLTNRKAG